MHAITETVDTTGFEQVCVLVYRRVRRLKRVPYVELCEKLRRMAEDSADDQESVYEFCRPVLIRFGAYLYPHEQFLRQNNVMTMEFWKRIIRLWRDRPITDPMIIGFADALCLELGIA